MYFLGFLFLTVIEKSFREDRNVYKCIILLQVLQQMLWACSLYKWIFKILAFNKFTNSKIKIFENVSRYNHR